MLLLLILNLTASLHAKEAVVNHQDYAYVFEGEKDRDWQKPDFSGQETYLGYTPTAFSVPPGLQEKVDFWKVIYSKYTTQQGLLHDSEHPHIIFDVVDFTSIQKDPNLNIYQKEKLKKDLVKNKKESIEEVLLKLEKSDSLDGLNEYEKKIVEYYKDINEPNKYFKAAGKGRLRFQLGQKDRFLEGIFYSGRYIQEMERIFRAEGMPIELTRLPFVESSFNLAARSKVGASGIWQFMRSTGRQYMRVDHVIDERNDPIVSTHAALKLLRYNYGRLKSWPLAVTAYNFGPSGLVRLVEKYQTTDLVEIIKKNNNSRFGFASGSFYASYLAALEVEANAKEIFGNPRWAQAVGFHEERATKPISYNSLSSLFEENKVRMDLFNPHFNRPIRNQLMPIPKGARVRVPIEKKDDFAKVLSTSPAIVRTSEASHQVAAGENLSTIARTYGVSLTSILQMNDLPNANSLKPGQILLIPKASD